MVGRKHGVEVQEAGCHRELLLVNIVIPSSGSHARKCRLQLDTGAMLSLVSAKLAHNLGAHKIKEHCIHHQWGCGDMFSSHQVEFTL